MTLDAGRAMSPRAAVCRLGAALVALALIATIPLTMTAAGAVQSETVLQDEPAVIVALESDGSAELMLSVTFNLSSETEREAFEVLRGNASARGQRTERFAARMRTIADRAETSSGREMRISQPSIRFVERGATGIVALSVRWDGLAARSGDDLVLREPFASGFTIDRSFRIVSPDGYRLASVTPSPTEQAESTATWAEGTSLDGFEATFVPSSTKTGASAPGFEIGIAVVAMLLSAGFLLYRSSESK